MLKETPAPCSSLPAGSPFPMPVSPWNHRLLLQEGALEPEFCHFTVQVQKPALWKVSPVVPLSTTEYHFSLLPTTSGASDFPAFRLFFSITSQHICLFSPTDAPLFFESAASLCVSYAQPLTFHVHC